MRNYLKVLFKNKYNQSINPLINCECILQILIVNLIKHTIQQFFFVALKKAYFLSFKYCLIHNKL